MTSPASTCATRKAASAATRAREAEIERLVPEAWRDRWVVTVVADEAVDHERRRDGDDPAPWVERMILRRRAV